MIQITYTGRLLIIGVFSVAMAYLEAAVVVYLRELYYPGGFTFPWAGIPYRMVIIETLREAATLVMLSAVAFITGRKIGDRLGYGLILFGVWDLFYYVWLKVLLDWPATFFDWDILFLIPMPWLAPVMVPILIAGLMIVFGFVLTSLYELGYTVKAPWPLWLGVAIGTLLILLSFFHYPDNVFGIIKPPSYSYFLLTTGLLIWSISIIPNLYISFKRIFKSKKS